MEVVAEPGGRGGMVLIGSHEIPGCCIGEHPLLLSYSGMGVELGGDSRLFEAILVAIFDRLVDIQHGSRVEGALLVIEQVEVAPIRSIDDHHTLRSQLIHIDGSSNPPTRHALLI